MIEEELTTNEETKEIINKQLEELTWSINYHKKKLSDNKRLVEALNKTKQLLEEEQTK